MEFEPVPVHPLGSPASLVVAFLPGRPFVLVEVHCGPEGYYPQEDGLAKLRAVNESLMRRAR